MRASVRRSYLQRSEREERWSEARAKRATCGEGHPARLAREESERVTDSSDGSVGVGRASVVEGVAVADDRGRGARGRSGRAAVARRALVALEEALVRAVRDLRRRLCVQERSESVCGARREERGSVRRTMPRRA